MIFKQLPLVIALLVTFQLGAQERTYTLDEINQAYQQNTMIFRNGSYVIDNVPHPAGLFRKRFVSELKNSEAAFKLYQKYRRKTWAGVATLYVGYFGGIIGTAVSGNPVFFLVGTSVGLGGGIILLTEGYHYEQQAIWQYNRDMLIRGLEALPVHPE